MADQLLDDRGLLGQMKGDGASSLGAAGEDEAVRQTKRGTLRRGEDAQ